MVVGKVVEEGVGEAVVVEAEVEDEVQVEGVRGVEVTGDAPWRTSERRASLRPKPSGLPERLRGELVSSLSPKARGGRAAGVRTAGESTSLYMVAGKTFCNGKIADAGKPIR